MIGDVNGDGQADLVFIFRHWSTGEFTIRVKYSTNDGRFTTSYASTYSYNSSIPDYPPVMTDVNGDGCADVVFPYRPASDNRYRLYTFRTTTCPHLPGSQVFTRSTSGALP